MEVSTFLSTMEKELMRNGFSKENAKAHTLQIAKSLSPSDKSQIAAMEDIGQIAPLARNYARRVITEYRKTHPVKNPNTTPNTYAPSTVNNARNYRTKSDSSKENLRMHATGNSPETVHIRHDGNSSDRSRTTALNNDVRVYHKNNGVKTNGQHPENNSSVRSRTPVITADSTRSEAQKQTLNTTTEILKVRRPRKKIQYSKPEENLSGKTHYVAKITTDTKVPLTYRGKKEYAKRITLNFLPIFFGMLFTTIGIIEVYALIGILISLFVALLVAFAIVGVVSGLAGLIYGIIKLFSVMPEGLFEIGLSIIIFSVTLVGCIFLYNVSVRIIPLLWKNFSAYVDKLKSKLRTHENMRRTECNSI